MTFYFAGEAALFIDVPVGEICDDVTQFIENQAHWSSTTCETFPSSCCRATNIETMGKHVPMRSLNFIICPSHSSKSWTILRCIIEGFYFGRGSTVFMVD